jgi:hypothetical protein
MEFDPPIHTRSTEELIEIANYPKKWDRQATDQAQKELKIRGVDKESQRRIVESWNEANDEAWREELERRKVEGYDFLEFFIMIIYLPRTLLNDWYLKADGYHRKYRQRLWSILGGTILVLSLGTWLISEFDKDQAELFTEIGNEDTYDWERDYYTDEEFATRRSKEISDVLKTLRSYENEDINMLLLLNNDTIPIIKANDIKKIDPMTIRVIQYENHSQTRVIRIVTINPSG